MFVRTGNNLREFHFHSPHKLKYGIGLILLIVLSLSAPIKAYSKLSTGNAGTLVPNANISFIENNGQIVGQNGNPRPDVKFLLDYKGLKIQLKENSFSYERYSVKVNSVDNRNINRNNNRNINRNINRNNNRNINRNNNPNQHPATADDSHKANSYNKISNSYNTNSNTLDIHRVDIEILGASKHPEIIATGPSDLQLNYFVGGKAIRGVKSYRSVKYKNIYPKIDLVFYVMESNEIHKNPEIKYDFIVHPGGRLEDIEFKFSGADGLMIGGSGELIIQTSQGSITEAAPISYTISPNSFTDYTRSLQVLNSVSNYKAFSNRKDFLSTKAIIESKFKLSGGRLSFECPDYDKSKILVIDPQLIWGTYFGGSNTDFNAGVVVDAAGNIILAGSTESSSMIATSGAYKTIISNGYDTFIAKFTPAGVQIWGTYYGGDGDDWCAGITVDDSRNIIICGGTTSFSGIATPGTHQTTHGGAGSIDSYIAKFTPNGGLIWGTYYGGTEFDHSIDISADGSGNIYTVGSTGSSSAIATPGAHLTTPTRCYFAKFNPNGQIVWGSYYGGSEVDIAWGIAVSSNGNFAICGDARSANGIATPGAYKETPDGTDAFLALFNSNGSRLWGTYFGGDDDEWMQAVLFDNNGDIVSCGSTTSTSSIATSGAHQTAFGGNTDGMLVKFSPSGELIWSTYYGGSGADMGFGIENGNAGNLVFTGITTSPNNISTPGAHQTQISGSGSLDAFVVKFYSWGSRIWGSYFGGANNEFSDNQITANNVIAVDGLNNIILSGTTNSIDGIATPGAHQENLFGASDCFIAKLAPFPQGLITGSVGGPFCAGDEFDIDFLVNQSLDPGNTFTAELSGPDGDFNVSRIIGSLTGRSSGTISVALPDDLAYGINYRIRINADSPASNGLDNGSDIVIYPLPQPIINGRNNSQIEVCQGAIESYAASDLAGQNSWLISGGNAISPLDSSVVTIEWGATGKGSITLSQTVDSSGCENSSTINVNITDKPVADFDAAESVCMGDTITVTSDVGQNEGIRWTPEAGSYSTGNNNRTIYITWDSAGVFDIRLIKWNLKSFCEDTLIRKITVLEAPRAEILGSAGACENHPFIYFAVDSNNTQSLWEVAGGTINGSDNQGHVVVDWGLSGPGNIRLIQRNIETGCTNTLDFPIIIAQSPAPDFTVRPEVCEGDEYVYNSNSATGINNKWVVSGGIISGADDSSEVVVKWANPGEAEITLTQTISGSDCIDSIKKSISIHPKPSPEILGEYSICANIINEFRATPAEGIEYEWTSVNGEIIGSNQSDAIEITWPEAGTDTLKLIETVAATGCSDSAFILVNISEFAKAEIFKSDDKVCQFDTLSFSTSSTYDIRWETAGGVVIGDPKSQQIEISWDKSGDYEVRLIHRNPDNGCIDTARNSITVHAPPIPIVTGTDASCTGCIELYSSAHTSEIAYWQVSGGNIIDSAGNNEISIEWTDSNEGIIKLVLINPLTGCRDSVEFAVSLTGSPGNGILGGNEVCSGSIMKVRSKQTFNSSFDWQVSGGTAIGATNEASVYIEWPEQGTGQIILYRTNIVNLDKDTSYLDIEIMPSPDAIIAGFSKANRNSRLQYATTTEHGINIAWSVTGGLISGASPANEINVDWGTAGNGYVELIKTNEINLCSDTARLEVLIIDSDANAILSVDRLDASPGENVVIPIRLVSSKGLSLARVSGFGAELRFNATVLSPTGSTPVGTVVDGVRVIPVNLPSIPIRDNILAEFDFTATLGNARNTILNLSGPEPVGGLAVVNEIDGSFQLTGLCQEGGTRLVISTKERSLGQNTPNPANESTQIIYTLIEPGPVSLELYNLYGELISVIENTIKSPGTYSLKYNTASLPSGAYMYILKTPTKTLSRIMKVLH